MKRTVFDFSHDLTFEADTWLPWANMAYPQISKVRNARVDGLEYISLAVRVKRKLAGCEIRLRDWRAIPLRRRCELQKIDADSAASQALRATSTSDSNQRPSRVTSVR